MLREGAADMGAAVTAVRTEPLCETWGRDLPSSLSVHCLERVMRRMETVPKFS